MLDRATGDSDVARHRLWTRAALLRIGDLVWFRHATGELFEHSSAVPLLAGDAFGAEVPAYQGCGNSW